jgi:hypothetical protein
MAVVEIPDFVEGKKTRKGQPLPKKEELVTAVTPDDIDRFLGARSERERRSHLRQRVRTGVVEPDGRFEQRRAYVFRGPWHAVPRIPRRQRLVRVFT